MCEPRLPFDSEPPELPDNAARRFAVDPTRNVVLEASAGTGKTRVLVERYVNLLRAGIDPDHILAITFTRKAAAEMRQRIVDRLNDASRTSQLDMARWRELKDRLGDIAISTIDAFCLSLLREFPLEADVDPAFELAADTDVPRLIEESLDAAFRICRNVAADDEDVDLLFAQLGERRLRTGIAALLDRRLIAPDALRRFLQRGPRDLTAAGACAHAAGRLRDIFSSARDGLDVFLDEGPVRHPQFAMLAADIRAICSAPEQAGAQPELFRSFIDRLRTYFLTQDGKPRSEKFGGTPFKAVDCETDDAWRRHRVSAARIAEPIADVIKGFRRDLNVVMSRGVWRVFAVALRQYQRTLEGHALLDFAGVLERAVRLLKDLDEFAQSRLRLEARYRHVLVDEFQDTSRAQWALVRYLVRSWGEGFGAADDAVAPSIFIVGDRKQSIYGFRDADVTVVDEAAQFIEQLRPDSHPRQAITVSFRSSPEILAFVNEVFGAIASEASTPRPDGFRYDEGDQFPVGDDRPDPVADGAAVRFIAAASVNANAERVASEVTRLLAGETVRDRTTGIRRRATAADIAILFRSRDSHRAFEAALDRCGVATYVYKGLGFFEADEVQDAVAVLRYLAEPLSDLRAATLLRSRIVRLSDPAIVRLHGASPGISSGLARVILGTRDIEGLGTEDRQVLEQLRSSVARWLDWVDRITPSELLTKVLRECAYSDELRGRRCLQARENLKKLRAMIRRAQNRGYQTLARIADHLDRLAVGDESNAAIDAVDAVSLMTVHAAKGLEFPIVFLVNLGRGTSGVRAPIRVADDPLGHASVAIADYQSEADEDAQSRDREETKRLLYVALTRARDRVYLSTTVENGTARMGRGSLGEVLPAFVKAALVRAADEP